MTGNWRPMATLDDSVERLTHVLVWDLYQGTQVICWDGSCRGGDYLGWMPIPSPPEGHDRRFPMTHYALGGRIVFLFYEDGTSSPPVFWKKDKFIDENLRQWPIGTSFSYVPMQTSFVKGAQ